MRKQELSPLWLLLLAAGGSHAKSQRRLHTRQRKNSPSREDGRDLEGTHTHAHDRRNFKPLSCNDDPCNKGNSTWTNQPFDPNSGTVVIPCGLCMTMDYNESDTLILPFGLDIWGTLAFPDGYKIAIETPFVRVQGNLEMSASNPVTDQPNVKIILTKSSDEDLTKFVPATDNEFACTEDPSAAIPTKCNVGTKPFVVAGGKLDIHGLPDSCPTWVHLQDVIHEGIQSPTEFTRLPRPEPSHANPRCRTLAPYMHDGFRMGLSTNWTGGYGAFFDVTDHETLIVTGRKIADDQGPTWDMLHVRDCLIPGQPYLFSARVRLSKNTTPPGTPTTCALSNTACLTLESKIRSPSRIISRRKGYDQQLQGSNYREWRDFYATAIYDEEELDSDNFYQLLVLQGPEEGVDIEIDNVRFTLPPVITIPNPDNVCGGNLVLNGNAEAHAIHPYPISSHGGFISVERERGSKNHYFHHFGRSSNSHSVLYSFDPPGCLVAKGKYKASAKVRIHSDVPVVSELQLRATFDGGVVRKQTIATCPPSTREWWTLCQSEVTVDPEILMADARNVRVQFETVDAPTVDVDVDDIMFKVLDGPVSSIVVPDTGVSNCWDEGAEILITSHTLNFDDEQVRRLTSTPTPLGDGTVKLDLDSPIIPPTTRLQSTDFATEVALLSRNILLEGEKDEEDELFGAHLIVLHTPTVKQYLEGVEFRNFGQQGNLGRYPIHFHMCTSVEHAVVSKNSIRESNQRCIVVHGTHNLTVNDNIAYDTKGHCFMLEDGGELNNVFRGNLGALTKPAEKLVSSTETDDEPSTFWCTNPENEWEGNVAAGSAENGFWFELRTEVRGPTAQLPTSQGMNPRTLSLKLFDNNVAHSNRRHGLRTYPSGYRPNEAALFRGTMSFKNRNEGVFFHNSDNLVVQGGVLADNRKQVDLDRADDIQLLNTSLIGVTEQYSKIVESQSGAPSHSDMVVGIELHGFALDMATDGAQIRDIKFSGFQITESTPTALIQIDDEVRVGHFDYWTTLKGVEISANVTSPRFDFAQANASGISNVYLTDLDSSMKPRGSNASGTSTVLSNSPIMTEFLNLDNCEEFRERSYMYCQNTCLRSVVYRVSPSETKEYTCRVSAVGNPGSYIDLPGKYHYETLDNGELDETENMYYRKSRYFSAALPPGSYNASFLDEHGNEVWPTFVETTVEKPQCQDAMASDAVTLQVPDTGADTCKRLIRNGDLEMSNNSYPFWLHRDTSLELVAGSGIDGTYAIADTIHTNSRGSIGQFLDTRCLEKGRQYEVRAWVKLEQNSHVVACETEDCPRARIRIRTPLDSNGLEFDEVTLDVAETFAAPLSDKGWNLLQGLLTIDDRIAKASSAWFFVERGMSRTKMYLDNVSVSMLPRSCDELVLNGNFSNGNSTFWEKSSDRTRLEMEDEGGNFALQMLDRSSSSDTPFQQIRTGCFYEGDRYLATAKFRLHNTDGSQYYCDVTTSSGSTACPRLRVKSYTNLGTQDQASHGHDGYGVAFTDHGSTSDGYYTMSGVFTATEADDIGEKSVLSFDRVQRLKNFAIDDVSIKLLPKNCSELIMNGNGDYGETTTFWRHWLNRGGAKIETVSNGLLVSNRQSSSDGIQQLVDPRCLVAGERWKVSVQMRLLSTITTPICNPSKTDVRQGCPPVRIAGWLSGVRTFDVKLYMTNRATVWEPDEFNWYETEFSVSPELAKCDRVSIGFRSFNLDWDLLLDDVRVSPMVEIV